MKLAGAGTSTSSLVFGGNFPPSAETTRTETWNGTNWTETSDLSTAREKLAGAGAYNTSALAFGGDPGPTLTEEWTDPGIITKTLTS